MIDVSDAEKKKDNIASAKSRINVAGKENICVIL
jgi:hypothetical protein